MMRSGLLADQIESYQDTPEFIGELIALEFLEQAAKRDAGLGVTQAELARRLDVTRPAVSQMFGSGAHNMTLLTMVRLSEALGGVLDVGIADRDSSTRVQAAEILLGFATNLGTSGENSQAQELAAAA